MSQNEYLKNKVLSLRKENFEELALEVFRFQSDHCEVYSRYIKHLNVNTAEINSIQKIPFLPIEFFKQHVVLSAQQNKHAKIFESSGTTGEVTSKHIVNDAAFYLQIATRQFEKNYQSIGDTIILALLPSYLERTNSSLVYMVKHFIDLSGHPLSGFFLKDFAQLTKTLKKATQEFSNKKIILIGVTFALLDLADAAFDFSFLKGNNQLIVMETGGMKGKRAEQVRDEVHYILKKTFYRDQIHSEYGMTELLSQAYSKGEGVFEISGTLQILLREINDPFSIFEKNTLLKTGGVNCIDLANIDSVSFIETKDLAMYTKNASLIKIMGRFDNTDQRGCNLMVQ